MNTIKQSYEGTIGPLDKGTMKLLKNRRVMLVSAGILIVLVAVGVFIAAHASQSEAEIPAAGPAVSSKSDDRSTAAHEVGDGDYDYTEAPDHIGEKATVHGTITNVFTAKSGVTFLDFCPMFDDCPFSAVIFADDAKKFKDLDSLKREVALTGMIKSYQGKAEMVISDPSQIK